MRRSEIRSQRSEGRGQRPEVRGRRAEDRGQRAEDRGQQLQIKSAKNLKVYQKAYALAMEIFQLSKSWPSEEKYSLTDQIRRASRSVCTNLREAWAKRRYEAHFISKLTDSDGENSETDTWLDFALDCGYLHRSSVNLCVLARGIMKIRKQRADDRYWKLEVGRWNAEVGSQKSE